MSRPASTADAFSAIAEPRRRQILTLLATAERPVNDLVNALNVPQPQVSEHLRVLREVGLVSVRGAGQRQLYRLSAANLKPVHDWEKGFEQFWAESFDRLDEYLKNLQAGERA